MTYLKSPLNKLIVNQRMFIDGLFCIFLVLNLVVICRIHVTWTFLCQIYQLHKSHMRDGYFRSFFHACMCVFMCACMCGLLKKTVSKAHNMISNDRTGMLRDLIFLFPRQKWLRAQSAWSFSLLAVLHIPLTQHFLFIREYARIWLHVLTSVRHRQAIRTSQSYIRFTKV
jgi:hypothetical protein